MSAHYAIRAVAKRTGLSAHVIRVWEKRYSAVRPQRTETGRRLYSDAEVEKLRVLREAIEAGHSIGDIAHLPVEKLRGLAQNTAARPAGSSEQPSGAGAILEQSLEAVRELNERRLENTLKSAESQLGSQGLLQKVIAPLAQRIGELWREGSITAAHEHFATAVIRVFLGHAARQFAGVPNGPVILIGTPLGQLHELGALLAGLSAANLGWNVTYLGASLPAAEIAGAARQTKARAVGLSVVYPEDDPRLEGELNALREQLPDDVAIVIGGRAAPAYRETLKKIGAIENRDLNQFCAALDELRKRRSRN